MDIKLISLAQRHGRCIARARALAPAAGAEIWIKVEFERGDHGPWQAAYDRMLSILDPA